MAPSAITTFEEYPSLSFETYKSNGGVTSPVENNHGAKHSKAIVGDALKERIETIDHDDCEVGDEDAFFVADMGEVYRQHLRWKLNLARVKPHYGEF